jgi:DNA-binding response OmpR family regulator
VLTHGDLTLDREGVTVTAAGKPVTVTAREFDILTLLMEHPKKVFTREQIYQHVWGEDYFGDDNTVNVHISNLRSKLGKVSKQEFIKTVWGIGFKMADC